MTDYENLYNQSQLTISKQKQQIKKLQQQIRQRCQSYLIHSSRYRSKNMELQKKKSAASEPDQQLPVLSIAHKTIQIFIQPTKPTYQISTQQRPQSAQATPLKQNKDSQKINENTSEQKTNSIFSSSQGIYWRNPVQKQQSAQIEKNKQLNNGKNENSIVEQKNQSKSIPINDSHINWEQVVSGYKDRLSSIQKQKSQLAQRVIDLEQQIKAYKKQQKTWTQNMNTMKKKQAKSQFIERVQNQEDCKKKDQVDDKQFAELFQILQDQINFNTINTIDQKLKEVVKYIKNMRKKIQIYEENGNLQQSKVDSYVYSTPYRNIKNDGESSQNQSRDHYQQQQLQMLRRKCKQLQGELSLSRANKNLDGPFQQEQQPQNQEQIKDPPYLIEQQLEKPNSPYVKRSFVRKKVVKRNLSAMILRSPSKSKTQSREAMKSQLQKLKAHLQKSKDGKNDKQISSMTKKIQNLERNLQIQQGKIDEMSEQNQSVRASGVSSQGNFTEIIQVQTQGPGFKNYTAHILGLNKKDKSTHEKQKKQLNI